jgi:transposase-like protein
METGKRYPVEFWERAVRLVVERRGEYDSERAAITSIARKFGLGPETLRKRLHRLRVEPRRPDQIREALDSVWEMCGGRFEDLHSWERTLARHDELLAEIMPRENDPVETGR